MSEQLWFKGSAYTSLQGVVQDVNLNQALPRFQLLLPGGKVSISCVASVQDHEAVQDAAGRRVRIYGLAQYKETSPVPHWIEVTSFELINEDGDLTVWRGSFKPFELAAWDGEIL